MTINPAQELAVFKTKPIGTDGNFVLGWQQFFQKVIADQTASAKAYSITHAQRLTLQTANVTLGSLVFETDTAHVLTWNGKSWVQLV